MQPGAIYTIVSLYFCFPKTVNEESGTCSSYPLMGCQQFFYFNPVYATMNCGSFTHYPERQMGHIFRPLKEFCNRPSAEMKIGKADDFTYLAI
jgi:hypothetical protein